jgi:hypothetical protein
MEVYMNKILFSLIFALFMSLPAIAQDNPALSVDDIQICTSVADRQPVGADMSFAKDVGTLYCFTKLSGAQDTGITHAWYYKDKDTLKVKLNVKAKTWRTWSQKNISLTSTGEWRVDVLSSDGKVLATKNFTIKE